MSKFDNNFGMRKFNFFGVGLINGVVLGGRYEALSTFSYDNSQDIKGSFRQKFINLKDIPFVRGMFVLLNYLIIFFKAFDLSLIVFNDKLLEKKVEHKLMIRKQLINFYLLVLLIGFISFLVLPLGIYFLLYLLSYGALSNFIMFVIRGVSIVAFLLALKLLEQSKEIYKYNAAINKANNAMYRTKYLDYSVVDGASENSVYSAGNFLVFSFITIFMFVPMISFKVHFLWDVLIKIVCSILIICLAYELLTGVEYIYRKNAFTKFLASPFLLMSRLTCSKCEDRHIKAVTYCYEELIQMTATRKDFEKERKSFRNVYSDIKQQLFEAGIKEAREADYLICDTLGLDRTELFFKDGFSKEEMSRLNKVLKARLNHKPLCKILNKKCFYGRDFFVNESVLSPRQETEILTSMVIQDIEKIAKKQTVLDLCTGSGAIGITIALETNAKVIASDKSKKALNVAQKNAEKFGAKVQFIQSDMFKNLNDLGKFDIIVSNPPYIAKNDLELLDIEVKNYDPMMALDGGNDGLDFYRQIARKSPELLKDNGMLYLEIGYDQAESVKALLSRYFVDIKVIKDYDNLDRIIIAKKG